jgi:arylsulfatase A-like enzyme
MDARPDDLKAVSTIADPQRRRLAAMTIALDRAVGAVSAALRRNKLDQRTLVIFTNDNGGDRVGLDANNAPLRGTKGTLLEGGVRVPLVVRYPNRQGAGTRRIEPVSLMDVLPTALAISGQPIPGGLDGKPLSPPAPDEAVRTLYWRYDNMAAVREGRWKLLRYPDRPVELYDLQADIGETNNRAGAEPERVRGLMKKLFAWEGTITHPRWNTGTYWSQEDVRRYSDEHVRAANAQERSSMGKEPAD